MNTTAEKHNGVVIRIRVAPNAKKTEITGIAGDRIKIRLHAPPVDGKANKELLCFLAKTIGTRKSACVVTRGANSRDKTVFIHDVKLLQVERCLPNHLSP